MRFFLIFAIVLWTSVDSTVSSQTLSTISGPFQGNPAISALTSDDCLSTVDWHKIILITAVPIAAGFGLLLLAAFLKDLRQACKSNRSCPPAPQTIGAKKERTYVIDVEYGGRTKWGLFLRWCAVQTSSAEIKNRRLVRLHGSTGFSNWVSFGLVLGRKSEQKTMTTPRPIGKLVAVETKYPTISDRLHPRALPTSNTGACLRGLFKRACDIEISCIRVKDTKTQDYYFTVSGPSSGGISSTDEGIITTLPLLYSATPPKTKISYVTYYFTNASLWTSTFMPQYQGNFTGVRHVTLLFTCISHTMVAADVLSMLAVDSSMEESIVLSWPNYNLTLSVVIRAAVVGVVVFAFICIVEMIFRAAPTVWSLHPPCIPVQRQNEDMLSNMVQPTCVQSVAGDFYGGNSKSVEGIPRKSSSAPDIMQTHNSKHVGDNTQMHFNQPALYGKGELKPCDILTHTLAKMNNAVDVKTKKAESPTTKTGAAGLARCSQWTVVNRHIICKLHAEKLNSKQFTTSKFDTKPDASLSPDVTINPTRDITNNSKNDMKLAVSSNCNVASSGNSSQTSDVTWIPCSSTSNEFKRSSFITDAVTSYQPRSTSSASAARSSSSLFSEESIEKARPDDDHDGKTIPAIKTKQTSLTKTILYEPLRSRPESISCTAPATIQPYYNKQQITIEKQAAGDSHCTARSEQYKFQDRDPSEEFVSYFAVLTEENIKTAEVKRTKNYINTFTDMGKAKIVILPYDDSEAPQDVSDIDEINIISIVDDIPPVKTNPDEKTPAVCAAVTTRADYSLNIPMDFELPSVTIQTSTSLRSVFFGIRKWFAGLLSKPRLAIGDDYKLEVTENDSSMKTLDENTCVLSVPQGAAANHPIQPGPSEAKTRHCTASIWLPISGNNNCDTEEKAIKSHHNLQGSVFQTASGMIEYNPVSSSTSWSSIQSVQNALKKQHTHYDDPTAINQNNSKDTTVTKVGRPHSPIKPDSVPSKEYLFFENTKTSEESSVEPKSSTTEGIHCSQSITSDDSACSIKYIRSAKNQDQNRSLSVKGVGLTENTSSSSYPQSSSLSDTHSSSIFSSSSVTDIEKPRNSYYQALYEADKTPSIVSTETNTLPVAMFVILICHVLLIASCVIAMWWSIYSLHGICWSAFWKWVATAVTAVLIQAIIYDTIKAAIITFLKRLSFKEETKPKPYSIIL